MEKKEYVPFCPDCCIPLPATVGCPSFGNYQCQKCKKWIRVRTEEAKIAYEFVSIPEKIKKLNTNYNEM